ncbi:hypothetical protein Nepgr_025169 [Nepenthes gracilis]|uniref:Growth-regulating factor n=1 Tax=Nepenthes gracilis TaxID=150966 RepID=A0AAD3Y181_NEPGR|nr:hypothetical protein Nepgr_025169 [Nepenthes gracilis]
MSGRSNFPFTASQWQELEHQALIYKHMAAGIPIPPDLLFTVNRTFDFSLSSNFFPYQTSPSGWSPYQIGYGKKLDPEPGRCRRTDGKKWRCSKEAYPDSKYCERHMHRGKNRSRKPVEEVLTAAAAAAAAAAVGNHPPSTISLITNTPSASNPTLHCLSSDTSCDTHHFLYPHSPNSKSPGTFRDRYLHGTKGEASELGFSGKTPASVRGFSGGSVDEAWQPNHFKIGGTTSLNQQKQSSFSDLQSGYPCLELKSENPNHEKQNQKCSVLRRDFNCDLSMKIERDNEPQKTIHRFFDEWPPKNRDSWQDPSTTELSISIPTTSSHDFSKNP